MPASCIFSDEGRRRSEEMPTSLIKRIISVDAFVSSSEYPGFSKMATTSVTIACCFLYLSKSSDDNLDVFSSRYPGNCE